ncbi:Uronyl 2-sulfotransferase [Holothuria leucospilota]|uniref:Uronyl 2-sulfotransferase n=1 Tax=Holothuria leucospilota TaxID=206669 RepID=A0A9Q1HED3_HOLLE|nr:Uronyl 2-sulfotransferase [Holothuria leucospilota]
MCFSLVRLQALGSKRPQPILKLSIGKRSDSLAWSRTSEKHIVSILDQVQPPYLFQRHIHYVNFKRHMAQEVVYINFIREPIARMVSQYYFARYRDGILGKARAKWKRPLEEFNETIDECVKHEHRDCSGHRTFYIIPFFLW